MNEGEKILLIDTYLQWLSSLSPMAFKTTDLMPFIRDENSSVFKPYSWAKRASLVDRQMSCDSGSKPGQVRLSFSSTTFSTHSFPFTSSHLLQTNKAHLDCKVFCFSSESFSCSFSDTLTDALNDFWNHASSCKPRTKGRIYTVLAEGVVRKKTR